jgi:DNA-directed RNA polymerase subunit omega
VHLSRETDNMHGGYSVARITIEDCLRKVPNRFLLVNMVAKRVRQIREGSDYLVSSPKNEDIVVALREVAAGKIVAKEIDASAD